MKKRKKYRYGEAIRQFNAWEDENTEERQKKQTNKHSVGSKESYPLE